MQHSKGRPRTTWSLSLWIGYWAALFVVTHRPLGAGVDLLVPGADKVIHSALYFVLALLGGWHMRSKGRRPSWTHLIAWAGVYAAYAGFDEWLQQFVERTPSLWDWIADVAGVAAATVILARKGRSDAVSEGHERSA
ncbi:MAG: VanZ family protein [Planctomycetota bacterium]